MIPASLLTRYWLLMAYMLLRPGPPIHLAFCHWQITLEEFPSKIGTAQAGGLEF